MPQVLEFKLPDLGEGLTEAEIVRWLVEVGDVVAIDQPVVEVETAKAMVEVPCPYGGVVTARFGEEGSELPVGAPLLTVAVGSGSGADEGAGFGSGESGAGSGAGEVESSGNVLVGYGTGAPVARRRMGPSHGPDGSCSREGARGCGSGSGVRPCCGSGVGCCACFCSGVGSRSRSGCGPGAGGGRVSAGKEAGAAA